MSINLDKNPLAKKHGLIFLGFNQDYGCFTAGLENGFRIYNSDPLKERMRTDFEDGGIGYVEMLFRSNYLALVGGGRNPKYPPNEVVVWDDVKKKCVIELKFRSEVKAVKLRRDRIVVVLGNKVIVHSFTNAPQRLSVFETIDNDLGLCALCPSSTNTLLAFPGRNLGHIQIVDIGEAKKVSNIVKAHESAIRCIAISSDGSKIASASEKGTLLRVFDTQSGQMLNELRRGWDTCGILSLSFNFDSSQLCACGDKGTVHIFNLNAGNNKTSTLSFMGDVVKYFGSEWSFAHFHLPETAIIAAFGTANDKNAVIVVCGDGSTYKYKFNSETGECQRESYNKFLKMTDDD